jgi:hypothetical protein
MRFTVQGFYYEINSIYFSKTRMRMGDGPGGGRIAIIL